jgi:hypothetical protein
MSEVISQEVIENFLNGWDPEEFIVGVEYDYQHNLQNYSRPCKG